MSEAPPDRDLELLAVLAERAVEAACKVHDKLMGAETTEDIATLGMAHQRLFRSARQTVALKLKATREAEQHQRWLEARTPPSPHTPYVDPDQVELDQRVENLQDAVGRLAHAKHGASRWAREKLDRFDRELDDWIDEPDFLDVDLDTLVARAAQVLDIGGYDRVQNWRDLPRPPTAADPATNERDENGDLIEFDACPPPEAPNRDSG